MESIIEALSEVSRLAAEKDNQVRKVVSINSEADGLEDGNSLLMAKTATLMRYNAGLVSYIRARVAGQDVAQIVEQLVEDWVTLSKIAPLEKKLQYQIDALLKNVSSNLSDGDDADQHQPDPDAVVIEQEEISRDSEDEAIYRPPRLSEVIYDGDTSLRKEDKRKKRENGQARELRNEGVRDMLAEIQGRPEEVYQNDDHHTPLAHRASRELEKRQQFEEDNFIRLSMSKKDKMRAKKERSSRGSGISADTMPGLAALAERVIQKDGHRKQGQKGVAPEESEEAEKMRQLDEIEDEAFKDQERSATRSSRGSQKKRRKR